MIFFIYAATEIYSSRIARCRDDVDHLLWFFNVSVSRLSEVLRNVYSYVLWSNQSDKKIYVIMHFLRWADF